MLLANNEGNLPRVDICLFAFSLLSVFCFVLCFLHMSNEAAKRELRRRHKVLYGVPLGQRTSLSFV